MLTAAAPCRRPAGPAPAPRGAPRPAPGPAGPLRPPPPRRQQRHGGPRPPRGRRRRRRRLRRRSPLRLVQLDPGRAPPCREARRGRGGREGGERRDRGAGGAGPRPRAAVRGRAAGRRRAALPGGHRPVRGCARFFLRLTPPRLDIVCFLSAAAEARFPSRFPRRARAARGRGGEGVFRWEDRPPVLPRRGDLRRRGAHTAPFPLFPPCCRRDECERREK